MSRENVAVVERAIDAWNRGDGDGFVECCHPNVEWFSAIAGKVEGTETVYRGREGMRRFWDEWHALWDLTIGLSEIRDLGPIVLGLGRIETRGAASRIDLASPIGYVFEMEEGMMRTIRAYLDQTDALEAVGLRE